MNITAINDRLLFQKIPLKNGMTLYAQQDYSFETVYLKCVAPVGHMHNSEWVLPGTAHYFEHMLMKRSKMFPEKSSFKEKVRFLGGDLRASTGSYGTYYDLTASVENFDDLTQGTLSQFFEPILFQNEIDSERGIISNERQKSATFHPSTSEKGQYINTRWRDTSFFSLEQKFGSDIDFESFTVDYFKKFHKLYFDKKTYFIAAGNFDLDLLISRIEQFSSDKIIEIPSEKFNPFRWIKPQFHEFATKETNRLEYNLGWIAQNIEPDETPHLGAVYTMLNSILVDYPTGSLMKWLRFEKGWVYELSMNSSYFKGGLQGGLMFPLNSMDQVEIVRAELLSRIYDSITGSGVNMILDTAKQKMKNKRPFNYGSLSSRVGEVFENISKLGRTYSQSDRLEHLNSVTTEDLIYFVEKIILPNKGELLVVPKS